MFHPPSRLALIGACVALHIGVVHAHDVALEGPIEVPEGSDAYVTADGEAVRTGNGHCLRLGGFAEDEQVDACEGIEAQVVEAAPEPEPEPEPVVAPPPPVAKVTLRETEERALFEFDSTDLTQEGEDQLAEFVAELERFDEITEIRVIGYTDAIGTDEYNMGLSERRATTIAELLAISYPDAEIVVDWRGEQNPIATNETPEGRQMNRRVELEATAAETTFE